MIFIIYFLNFKIINYLTKLIIKINFKAYIKIMNGFENLRLRYKNKKIIPFY